MSISKETVAKVARLAHLDLDEAEAERMASDLGAVLDYTSRLDDAPSADAPPPAVAPTVAPTDGALREDRVEPGLAPGEAVAGAPDRDGDLFRVPPAIPGE